MKTAKYALPISLGFLFLMLPGPLQADTIPISGTISATNTLGETSPNIFSGTSTGAGVDTTFGAFTFSSAETATLTDMGADFLVSNGTFVDTYAAGTLTGTITGKGTVNTSTKATTFTENLIFTSGTGIFAGVETGQATLAGTGFFELTGPSIASYAGTITIPEPSTLVLLSAGLLGLMGMGLRKRLA